LAREAIAAAGGIANEESTLLVQLAEAAAARERLQRDLTNEHAAFAACRSAKDADIAELSKRLGLLCK
jgi:hypothetical protein